MESPFRVRRLVWNQHCYNRSVIPAYSIQGSATIHSVKRQAKPVATIEAQIQRAIGRLAESDCPILIAGERGVGKRSVAEHIHAQSHRSRAIYTEIQSADATVRFCCRLYPAKGRSICRRLGILASPCRS